MEHSVVMLGRGGPGNAEPLDPESLAALHPAWARDVERFGPWRPGPCPFPWGGAGEDCWLSPGAAESPLLLVGPCGSALDAGWDLHKASPLPDWFPLLAVEQRAGRGQLRRPWNSPPGNVHGVLAWPEPPGVPMTLTPLLAGAALAHGLSELGVAVDMKWPNDLLWRGRKVGGLLVEERAGRALLGAGLNLAWAPGPDMLRDEWAVEAGSLESALPDLGPLGLWTRLVESARCWYEAVLRRTNPSDLPRLLEKRLAWLGRTVRVHGGGAQAVDGAVVLLGLARDGGLRVLDRGEERILYSGSLALAD